MTTDTVENSVFDAFPIELYAFSQGVNVWRYTSADEDKTPTADTYFAAQIARPPLTQKQDMSKNHLLLKMEKGLTWLDQFRNGPVADMIQLTVQSYHEGDGEVLPLWAGRVINVKFFEREAEVRCEPVFTAMRRLALRRMYQTTCPHVLYGSACGVNKLDFLVPATITGIAGNVLTSPAFAAYIDGYFAGGFVEMDNAGVIDRRFITDHVGDEITINYPYNNLTASTSVSAFPGCDHLLATCNTKFSNENNYGGQPFFGEKNPMNGTPIF